MFSVVPLGRRWGHEARPPAAGCVGFWTVLTVLTVLTGLPADVVDLVDG